jgi:ABC-2 type transport system ATP-binding protein
MRRRLDVAAALVHRPRVLFLDEPTTGLDPEAWAEIRRLAGEEALTVVLTTHYMEEADRLADELLLVNRGRAVVQGTPDQLKAALHGDSLRVSLVEPDAAAAVRAAVRAAVARVPGLRDVVVEASARRRS